eukprot:TRINITY_DN652_c0_g1_i2.p1 TRINITY_DN652_c0_g1~~TRINITY_DN652_c0_g1_i2.p1  ORF type:complete len:1261 (+),score=472.77 TRINITY_DN652_c0_g1_i2:64-3783(+)
MRCRAATAAAALLATAGASSTTFLHKQCSEVTLATWKDKKCWDPAPPAAADTVVFSSGAAVKFNTTVQGTDVDAVVVQDLVVSKGAAVTLVEGTIELRGSGSVAGQLTVHGNHDDYLRTRATANPDSLKIDAASRALGLRDCAYTPIGFTPRLCGSGKYSIESGGEIYVTGLFASVFSSVQVKKGGTYRVSDGAHPWGLVTNEGLVTTKLPDTCGISPSGRSTCYNSGGTKDGCTNAGCCWDDSQLCTQTGYACSYPSGADTKDTCESKHCCFRPTEQCDTSKWPFAGSCEPKDDTEQACLDVGCCYNASAAKGKKCVYDYNNPPCRTSVPPVCYNEKATVGLVYWHGMLDNLAGGKAELAGDISYDEYSLDGYAPEQLTKAAFTNAGELEITGTFLPTEYTYKWGPYHGLYYTTVLNKKGGTFMSGSRAVYGNVTNFGTVRDGGSQYQGVVNHGVFEAGSGRVKHFVNEKDGKVSGNQLQGFLNNSGVVNVTVLEENDWTAENHADMYLTGSYYSMYSSLRFSNGADGRLVFTHGTRLTVAELNNAGSVVVDGGSVWALKATCVSCHYYLADSGELHLQSPFQGHAPRGLIEGTGMSLRGTPKLCTGDACTPDPCPYAIAGNATRCTVNGTDGVLAYGSTCYACGTTHPLGLLGDVSTLERLVQAARARQDGDGSGRPGTAELTKRLYHFEAARVDGDGSGTLVLTGPVHLHGSKALSVSRSRVSAVVEQSRPVLVGGGELVLAKASEFLIGAEAGLDDGGRITALAGSSIVVDAHSHIHAVNHSMHIGRGSRLRVDGSLRFGARSSLQSCGPSVGSGTLSLDDPATATTCAAAAPSNQCMKACSSAQDCSGAGQCTECHAGLCVEGPGCGSDEDCALNGRCVGGTCVNCDSDNKRPPFVGTLCSTLRQTSAGSYLTFQSPTGLSNYSGAAEIFGGFDWAATGSPPGCDVGGPDDFIVRGLPATDNRLYQHVITHQARNLQEVGTTWLFDYGYPRRDEGCYWKEGECLGTCSGGAKCAHTSAAECGCPVSCSSQAAPKPGTCSSFIAAVDRSKLGDCGPGRTECWCGRDGEQRVKGTSGCPSNPFMIAVNSSDPKTEYLLFYNMGDGKSIGMAKGPLAGPWKVVKEPVVSGMQDPWVYTEGKKAWMLGTGVEQQDSRLAFSSDAELKTWGLAKAPVLPMEDGGKKFASRTHPKLFAKPSAGYWQTNKCWFATTTVKEVGSDDEKTLLTTHCTEVLSYY